MPSSPLRIAILECDIPLPQVVAKYGTYGKIFTNLLTTAAQTLSTTTNPDLNPKLSITSWDILNTQTYPSLSAIDAILITGSRHTAFDTSVAWINSLVEYTRKVLSQSRVRIIGICFGHQIIGRAMNTAIGKSAAGWEASVLPMRLTSRGREVFAGKETIALHQMHRDVVYEAPPGTEVLGFTEGCAVQGLFAARRLISVQGHPEFDEWIVRELLLARHASGVLADEVFQDAMLRVGEPQDGVEVAATFLRFLLED